MGPGGRAVLLFVVRLAWFTILVGAAFLGWLIWSVWSDEAAIRAASLPGEGRILSKREMIERGTRGGRFSTPDRRSWEVVALVTDGPLEPESARRQMTAVEVRARLSEVNRQAEDALAEANRALADVRARLGEAGFETSRRESQATAATGGFTLPPLPAPSQLTAEEAPEPGTSTAPTSGYVIEFETNSDPGAVGETVPLLIHPADVSLSATADFFGRWNRTKPVALYAGAGLAILLMFLLFSARGLFGRPPRSVGRRG